MRGLKLVLGLFVAMSASSAFGWCNQHRIDTLSHQLDEYAHELHEELHYLANRYPVVRAVDAAADQLHDAAHHLHDSAHMREPCSHLEIDFYEVRSAYSRLQREWHRAHYYLHGQYRIERLYSNVRHAYYSLSHEFHIHHHPRTADNKEVSAEHKAAVEAFGTDHADNAEHNAHD